MEKIQILVLVFFLSLTFTSCKKTSVTEDENFISNEQNSVQHWLNLQKVNSPTKVKQIDELNNDLLFNKLWVEKNQELGFIIIPINERHKFSNNKNNKVSSYFVSVTNLENKILYSVIIQNKPDIPQNGTGIKQGVIANIYKDLVPHDNCNLRFITIYDYYLYEKNYKNNALYSTLNLVTKKLANDNLSKQIDANVSGCLDWYWVTLNADGTQTAQYLYTTCGSCAIPNPNEQTIVCENGSEGSNSPQAELENQFNVATLSISSPATITNSSISSPNPITGTYPWYVVQGQFANWKVESIITYGYYHHELFNINTNSFEQSYDLYNYSTSSGSYTGSNSLITTSWSIAGVPLNQVFNNNSENTYGKSIINGTLHHVCNVSIPNPIPGGSPITLQSTNGVSGGVTFNPR